jgi:hypothetical protein
MFFELRRTYRYRDKPHSEARKNQICGISLDSQSSKVFSVDPPVVQVRPSCSWRKKYFPFRENFRRQKHHDLAGKFGVWHVMCSCIPISCRRLISGAGVAPDMRSASPTLVGPWPVFSFAERLFPIHNPKVSSGSHPVAFHVVWRNASRG